MQLSIRYYGDPVLREESCSVGPLTEKIRTLAGNMVETLYAEQGVGLAAQQIGSTDSICVIHVPAEWDVDADGNRLHPEFVMPMILLNPQLSKPSAETDTMEEGCLSFPDIKAPIRRAVSVCLRYDDLKGQSHTLDVHGFLARVVQHEIDHLNGVLFIDRMRPTKKAVLSGRLRRMRKETKNRLGI